MEIFSGSSNSYTNTSKMDSLTGALSSITNYTATSLGSFLDFVSPRWFSSSQDYHHEFPSFRKMWQEAKYDSTFSDFLLKHFDANNDGHISTSELMNLREVIKRMPPTEGFWTWFSREWPLMDWKLGVFLWQSFGGILLLLALLSIVPGRLHGISAQILRWPVLGLTYFLIIVELVVYCVIRLSIVFAEALVANPKHARLRKNMKKSQSYEEWYSYALALDKSQRRDRWRESTDDETSIHYNWAFIRELVRDLRMARENEDINLALTVVQHCTKKNVGGIFSEDLFSYTYTGEPKTLVNQFVEEVVTTVEWLTQTALVHSKNSQSKQEGSSEHSKDVSNVRQKVLAYIKRARVGFGRTSLCLSGGAMMGLYHFGHIKGLLETDCLPHIISGTSAGAVVASVLCTRTDEELKRDMTPEVLSKKMKCFERPWLARLRSVMKSGNMFSEKEWLDMVKWFTCGDLTFEEAYQKTGRVFCITLSSTSRKAPPVLLNYLTAPNVTVASAVVASAAVPGLVPPIRLQYKDSTGKIQEAGQTFFDGSIRQDIPTAGLAEMLNVQFFIACQANPHIVPFFFRPKGGVGKPSRWSSGDQQTSWRGGFLLAALEMYLKNDMKAKLKFLEEVEAALGFTATMLTQEFVGSTTVVPNIAFADFFRLFSDPRYEDLDGYFRGGCIAVYEHAAMIKLHYRIADCLEECVARLEEQGKPTIVRRRSTASSAVFDPRQLTDRPDFFQSSALISVPDFDPDAPETGKEGRESLAYIERLHDREEDVDGNWEDI